MDDLYPFLHDFRQKLLVKEEEREERNAAKTVFHSAYENTHKREEKQDEQPLNLIAVGPKMWSMMLHKLSYQELARMEETCRAMAGIINQNGIVGDLEAFGLHFKEDSMCVDFNGNSYHNYTLDDINIKTTAAIHAKVLLIESEVTKSTVEMMKKLLKENEARVETIQLGTGYRYGRVSACTMDTTEFYELIPLTKAKRLVCHYGLLQEDLRRPEIKQLEALELHQPIEEGLTPPILRQIPCPVLIVSSFNEVAAETLTSLLQQWKQNQRSIKRLTVDRAFPVQDVLNPDESTDLEAVPIWTYYEQDKRVMNLIPMGKASSKTNIQILLIRRGEQRKADDFLILFFGRYRFIAATLDGIVEENVLDELRYF